MVEHKNVTRVIKRLKRAIADADREAGGVAVTVPLTRHEILTSITDLTDVDARGQMDPSALKRRRAARR